MSKYLLISADKQVADSFSSRYANYYPVKELITIQSIALIQSFLLENKFSVIIADCTSLQKHPTEIHNIISQLDSSNLFSLICIVSADFEDLTPFDTSNIHYLSYPFRNTEIIGVFKTIDAAHEPLLDNDVQRADTIRYQSADLLSNSIVLSEVVRNSSTGEISCRDVRANSNFEKNTGLTISELKNKLLSELYPKNDQRRVIEKAGLEQKTIQFDEYSPKTKRHYRVFAFSPQMNQVAALLLDISEIKNNQAALKAAQLQSKQAEALKTAFIANLSHEIRTPMNSIVGFSGLLDSEDITIEKKQLFVSQIQKSCTSLLNLIEDMLDLSRLQSNQLDLQSKQFTLSGLLLDLQAYLQKKISDSEKINDIIPYFQSNTLVDRVMLKADKNRLLQILRVLLDNAVKYTEKGTINVSWNFYPAKSSDEVSTIEFCVSDTGIGMHEDQIRVIFEAFSKIETGNSARYGGIGIGLTLAKKICILMQGNLWVESKLGSGSMFHLSLPIAFLHQSEESNLQEKTNNIDQNWSNKTILLVDDEEMNLFFLEELLSSFNATLLYADNGIEAIECCKKNQHIDLVIMDLRMPFMDGYTATTKIKSQFPHIPVIMQTTLSPSDDVASITSCGADDFIAKPIDVQLFIQIIKQHLTPSVTTNKE